MLMPKNEKNALVMTATVLSFVYHSIANGAKFLPLFCKPGISNYPTFINKLYSTAYKQFKIQYCSKTFQKACFYTSYSVNKKKKTKLSIAQKHQPVGRAVTRWSLEREV